MPETGDARVRLLVLDDEPLVCELVSDLATAAHAVARSASSAVDIAARAGERYDLVVVDLHLGEVDVLDVLSRVAVSSPGCSVALMTGSSETAVGTAASWARSRGLEVVAQLRKPVDLRALRQLLGSVPAGEPVA